MGGLMSSSRGISGDLWLKFPMEIAVNLKFDDELKQALLTHTQLEIARSKLQKINIGVDVGVKVVSLVLMAGCSYVFYEHYKKNRRL